MRWQDKASCAGKDTNTYFEIYEENPEVRPTVDKICKSCPVRRTCFEQGWQLKSWGVWGGMYLIDGDWHNEFNNHKSDQDWFSTWSSLKLLEVEESVSAQDVR